MPNCETTSVARQDGGRLLECVVRGVDVERVQRSVQRLRSVCECEM